MCGCQGKLKGCLDLEPMTEVWVARVRVGEAHRTTVAITLASALTPASQYTLAPCPTHAAGECRPLYGACVGQGEVVCAHAHVCACAHVCVEANEQRPAIPGP